MKLSKNKRVCRINFQRFRHIPNQFPSLFYFSDMFFLVKKFKLKSANSASEKRSARMETLCNMDERTVRWGNPYHVPFKNGSILYPTPSQYIANLFFSLFGFKFPNAHRITSKEIYTENRKKTKSLRLDIRYVNRLRLCSIARHHTAAGGEERRHNINYVFFVSSCSKN
jgi:hypothetical protein